MNLLRTRAAAALIAAGTAISTSIVTGGATAHATNPCTDAIGGDWNFNDGVCTSAVTSIREAIMTMSVSLPPGVVETPVRDYLRSRAGSWRTKAATMIRASDSSIDIQSFSHGPLKSLVVHEVEQTVGSTPNNSYRTFTFNVGSNRQLQLGDLFRPGIDPLTALPPLVRPFLIDALDRAQPPHDPGTYPFTPDKFEPQADGSGYADNYRAFAVTDTEFVLYLPGWPMRHENPYPQDRLQWSMDGGAVIVRVPLAALAPIMRVS
ncbi:mannan-binding protein [Mycobacterium sp. HM-7]